MSGSSSLGKTIAGAVVVALDDANKSLGVKLEFEWTDDQCSASGGLAALTRLLEYQPEVVVGPGCSAACESTGFLTAGLNIPQISWGCASPLLSDTIAYPTFARTAGTYAQRGPCMISFMKHYTLKRIVLVSSKQNLFSLSATDFAQLMRREDVHVALDIRFKEHKFGEPERRANLDLVRRTHVRIVLFLGYGELGLALNQTNASVSRSVAVWGYRSRDGSFCDGWL